MFITAQLTVAIQYKQLKCPLADGMDNGDVVHTHTYMVEFNSPVRKIK